MFSKALILLSSLFTNGGVGDTGASELTSVFNGFYTEGAQMYSVSEVETDNKEFEKQLRGNKPADAELRAAGGVAAAAAGKLISNGRKLLSQRLFKKKKFPVKPTDRPIAGPSPIPDSGLQQARSTLESTVGFTKNPAFSVYQEKIDRIFVLIRDALAVVKQFDVSKDLEALDKILSEFASTSTSVKQEANSVFLALREAIESRASGNTTQAEFGNTVRSLNNRVQLLAPEATTLSTSSERFGRDIVSTRDFFKLLSPAPFLKTRPMLDEAVNLAVAVTNKSKDLNSAIYGLIDRWAELLGAV